MKPRTLVRGIWPTRIARGVALALVSLGWRPGQLDARAAAPDPQPTPPPAPGDCAVPTRTTRDTAHRPSAPVIPTATIAALGAGADGRLLEAHVNRGLWPRVRHWLLTRSTAPLGDTPLEQAIVKYLAIAEPRPSDLRAVLATVLAEQRADVTLAGWVFQVARDVAEQPFIDAATRDALAALWADAALHARLHTAVVDTLAETGPVTFRAWMSKAAPRPGYSGIEVPADFWTIFAKRAPTATAGPWDDPVLDVTVVSGARGAAHRAWGDRFSLADGQRLQLGRLELVQPGKAPLVLRHATLGPLTIPPGTVLTALNAHTFMTAEARKSLDDLVQRALRCDATALTALQAVMPLAHRAIREALATASTPSDAGGRDGRDGRPGLRLLLALFDE